MGVGGAAGRSVEFGEREGGAEFEAAGRLPLCEGDGGLRELPRPAQDWRVRA